MHGGTQNFAVSHKGSRKGCLQLLKELNPFARRKYRPKVQGHSSCRTSGLSCRAEGTVSLKPLVSHLFCSLFCEL